MATDSESPSNPDEDDGAVLSRRKLLFAALATVVITAAGLVAAKSVRSPQQSLADAAPPAATTLTAPVEHRVLTDTVVLRGLVAATSSIAVSAPSTDALVTKLPVTVGQEVGPGTVVLEMSGRPVVVLPGSIPAYRDLLPGTKGNDVEQLQRALDALGFVPGSRDGVMGAGTKGALIRFYDSIGYEVPMQGDSTALTSAQEMVRTAKRALAEASAELDQLNQPVAEEGATAPSASQIASAERQVNYAKQDVTSAEAALAETERVTGPMFPMAEVVFVPTFPVRVTTIHAAVGERGDGQDGPISPLTLESGDLVVTARLDQGQAGLVVTGMTAEIYSEVLGVSASAVVSSIGALELDEETGVRFHSVVVRPETPLDTQFAGQDVRLTVKAASSNGEVLVVPVSAIYSGADGKTAVLVHKAGGTVNRIMVNVGLSGDGYVEIKPGGGGIAAGDLVVVGRRLEQRSPTSVSSSTSSSSTSPNSGDR